MRSFNPAYNRLKSLMLEFEKFKQNSELENFEALLDSANDFLVILQVFAEEGTAKIGVSPLMWRGLMRLRLVDRALEAFWEGYSDSIGISQETDKVELSQLIECLKSVGSRKSNHEILERAISLYEDTYKTTFAVV